MKHHPEFLSSAYRLRNCGVGQSKGGYKRITVLVQKGQLEGWEFL